MVAGRAKYTREEISENPMEKDHRPRRSRSGIIRRALGYGLVVIVTISGVLTGLTQIDAPEAEAIGVIPADFSQRKCDGWTSTGPAPSGVVSVTFKVIGGGGAGGDNNGATGGQGGGGAIVKGTYAVSPGAVLWAWIGCGGIDGGGNSAGYAKGGDARTNKAGGGGAASAICIGTSTANCGSGNVLAIAGGGGGGGAGITPGGACSKLTGGTGGDGSGGSSISAGGGTVYSASNGTDGGGSDPGMHGNGGTNTAGAAGSGHGVTATAGTGRSTTPPSVSPGNQGMGGTGGGDDGVDSGGGGGGYAGGGAGGGGHYPGSFLCIGTWDAAGGAGGGSSWVKSGVTDVSVSSVAGKSACGTGAKDTNIVEAGAGQGGQSQVCGRAGWVSVDWNLNSTGTAWATSPSTTGTAGLPLAIQPRVRATNTGVSPNVGIPGESIRMTINGTSELVSCSTNPMATDANGYATFGGCRFETEGTYQIRVRNMTTGVEFLSATITIASNNDWSGYQTTRTACGTGNSFSQAIPATAMTLSAEVSGGGGGAGGVDYNRDSYGGNGAKVTVPAFSLRNGSGDLIASNIVGTVGCGGGGGGSADQKAQVNGGAGGSGFGNGGSGGHVLGNGKRRKLAGGGGGGGTAVCLDSCTNVSSGRPIAVAGGGGGGGGNFNYGSDYGTNGPRGGGSGSAVAFTSNRVYYGASGGPTGSGYGGQGGSSGNAGAGGGGGGDSGTAGANGPYNGQQFKGGAGGVGNAGGQGGQGYGGNGANGSGSLATGGNGGAGATGRDTGSRSSSGGGGGGGYYGGGGGGSDDGSNLSGGGGGSGSSWGNATLGVTPSYSPNGGGAGGAGRYVKDVPGYGGANGSAKYSLAGKGIILTKPADRTDDVVGSGLKTLALTVVTSTVDGHVSAPTYTIAGAPPGWVVSSTGVITGVAPTVADSYSITVTASVTTDSQLTPANIALTQSVTFTWTFKPAPASRLAIVDHISNPSPVGEDLALGVQVQDEFGNAINGATNAISLALTTNPSNASLDGVVSATPSGSVAKFNGFQVSNSGFGYQITASSPGLASAVTDPFDAVVIAETTLTLTHVPEDPGLLNNDLPASGVASVSYYRCPGWTASTACGSPTLIGTSTAVDDEFIFEWSNPPIGDSRILAVQTDNVGNQSELNPTTGSSTPVRVLGSGLWVEYMVVAGGGSGGPNTGGGGGAGGLVTGTVLIEDTVAKTVTVGDGADGFVWLGSCCTGKGHKGENSQFANYATAIGGGAGGANSNYETALRGGGSGGGGGHNGTTGGPGTAGQGNTGGNGSSTAPNYGAAGGGGRTSAGQVGANTKAGAGGTGYLSSITGSIVAYAGGGGGGCYNAGGTPATCAGAGGSGVGGNGGIPVGPFRPTAGAANTGGGGGGHTANAQETGAAGGSGIVVIRYKSATKRASGGSASQVGEYWVHVFANDGSFQKTN